MDAVFISLFANILVLTSSWYMLEVYDRVVATKSVETLVMLSLLAVFLFFVTEVFGYVRNLLLQRAGNFFEIYSRELVFNKSFLLKLQQQQNLTIQPFNDLRVIKETISSPGLKALMDAPFSLIFLIILFVIHPAVGILSSVVALVMVMLSIYNDKRINEPLLEANKFANQAQVTATNVIKNAQVVESMGMQDALLQKWSVRQNSFLSNQAKASDAAGENAAISKFIQTTQASLILGFTAYLTLSNTIIDNGSLIIVASILGGRVIAPIGTIMSHWRSIVSAKDSLFRLHKMLEGEGKSAAQMSLPSPKGNLSVENLVVSAPNSHFTILKGVTFSMAPSEVLAVIGPSASGKTTLSKVLTGVWGSLSGSVRLDGVDVFRWNKDELGPYVGYLAQNVDLFDGTIAQNVSRFGDCDDAAVHEALSLFGLLDFIETLSDGVHTQIGQAGAYLSGGQRQLIALARAFYKSPKYIVLDEPNSNLDEVGDKYLTNAIAKIREKGSVVIVITHRKQLLDVADKIMLLIDGQTKMFGPRLEVLKALADANQKQVSQAKPIVKMDIKK